MAAPLTGLIVIEVGNHWGRSLSVRSWQATRQVKSQVSKQIKLSNVDQIVNLSTNCERLTTISCWGLPVKIQVDKAQQVVIFNLLFNLDVDIPSNLKSKSKTHLFFTVLFDYCDNLDVCLKSFFSSNLIKRSNNIFPSRWPYLIGDVCFPTILNFR